MVNITDLKTPPHSLEHEKYVLSCFFLDSYLINTSPLTVECFYSQRGRDLYKRMLELNEEKREIDIINMSDKIQETGYDIETVYDICSYAITASSFEEKCEKLIEYANRRKILKLSQDLMNKAQDIETDYSNVLQSYGSIGEKLHSLSEEKTIVPLDTFRRLFEEKKPLAITRTSGFAVMDDLIRGYRIGSLYAIGARPSMGKSTLAVNLLLNALDQGIQCALFSTEMPVHEIHVRVMSNLSKIPSGTIENGLDSVAEEVSDKVIGHNRDTHCAVYDDFDTFENLEVLLAKEATKGTKIMFIDYLQQIGSTRRVDNLNNFIGHMTTKMKKLAIKYGVCIVIMVQLSRQADPMKEPSMKWFRDSGNIEQDIDVGMILHAYDEYTKELDIHVVKNRHGAKGPFRIGYRQDCFYMYDI